MKHVTYAEKPLLTGDSAAGLLLVYAAALGSTDRSDTVTLHASMLALGFSRPEVADRLGIATKDVEKWRRPTPHRTPCLTTVQ
jgi:hypothetical protein